MKRIFALFATTLIFMELVYHVAIFGFEGINPVLMIPMVVFLAGLQTLGVGFFRKKVNRVLLWIFLGVDYLLYAVQLIYISIFKQPLLTAAMTNAGADALTNYWRETIVGILRNTGWLLLMAVPLIVTGILLHFGKISLKSHKRKAKLWNLGILTGGVTLCVVVLLCGFLAKMDFYEEYQEFYDPSIVIENYGVLASMQRDAFGDLLPQTESAMDVWIDQNANWAENSGGDSGNGGDSTQSPEREPDASIAEPGSSEDGAQGENPGEGTGETGDVVDTSPNVLDIDFEKLSATSDTKDLQKLAVYLQTVPPTNKNEYTGMFEGYNLIYLTAEGFSPYAVDEQLTPTLYKLSHSGFVAEDYYVPLWQTSTSDGEYVNLTGLIPDQQFSMRRSAANEQPFSLPAYFAKEGVKSYAYHNNNLEYYDRYKTHPNLGYNFKASKLKKFSMEEWGDYIFEMEGVDDWPASDLNMVKATLPEYIGDERFHVYYMTVSGHMNYNFIGNGMARKNKDAVANLPYSEEGRAYIACNIELDKALQYLIEELEKAGKLDNTVIVLSADHYPYDMNIDNLEELAGKPLEGTLEIYKNSLILWNSQMETIEIEKTCSALDLLPTLLNLFGFEYDSRLYAGRDMLSDSQSLVIFTDRSFITDTMEYNRKAETVTSRTGEEVSEEYFEMMKTQVKGIYEYSAGILNNNFYKYVEDALPEEWEEAPPLPLQ